MPDGLLPAGRSARSLRIGSRGKGREDVKPPSHSGLAAFRGARVMITGGAGLIGSALARRLAELGAEVVLIDSMVPEAGGNLTNLADIEGRVRLNIADIRDAAAMRHLLAGREFLFDLAGQTSHLDSM